MKLGVAPVLVLLALVTTVIGCRSGNATPTPTQSATPAPERTETPTAPPIDILPSTPTAVPPPPTPTPLPPASPSGLWTFDLGRGQQVLLYEGSGQITSTIEASGNVVAAVVVAEGRSTATRTRTDGATLETHEDRGLIVGTPNGEQRFYLDLTDPAAPALVLERNGEIVTLEGTRPRVGVSFSPSGDRLLAVSERPGLLLGEVVRTYSVHETADGRLRMQFEHRAIEGTPPVARWSPSGRYIADEGIGGLFVRDTFTGLAWRLGPAGSARWSPLADRLIAVDDFAQVSIIDIPDLDRLVLEPVEGAVAAQFDRTGRLAIVTADSGSAEQPAPITRAYEVTTGQELAAWPGASTFDPNIGGADPTIALDGGIAALVGDAACPGGFVVHHPALSDDGRCLEGTNPRWSPRGDFLVYARDRELVVLSLGDDSERVIIRGTPTAGAPGGPELYWSPDGSWLLVEWSAPPSGGDAP